MLNEKLLKNTMGVLKNTIELSKEVFDALKETNKDETVINYCEEYLQQLQKVINYCDNAPSVISGKTLLNNQHKIKDLRYQATLYKIEVSNVLAIRKDKIAKQ